ncbi:sodium/nucleoside cotransporter 1 [Agrilus planipennis]|uniref:Sodium/nucleoside cotransporter 1 n=1 Tax=Agrilus planipennis TaxID=224129 RepID=A0A7F5RDX8_AGRPL|nr:sodium/nucleoside cotransporter 1 [Agrilus planipennis]
MNANEKNGFQVDNSHSRQSTIDLSGEKKRNDETTKSDLQLLPQTVINESNDGENKEKKRHGISVFIINFNSNVRQYKEKHDTKIKFLTTFLVHLILLGYFCWATQYFLKQDISLSSTTCNGYGFLMIAYIIIYFTVIYYLILKPFVLPLLFKPLAGTYKRVSSIRFIGPIIHGIILIGCIVFIAIDSRGSFERLIPLAGLLFLLLFGFAISSNHRKINWDIVIAGLDLQFLIGMLAIRWETGRNVLVCVGDKATAFLSFANNGSSFVYGDFLIMEQGVFAFQALSTILFVGMVVSILFHLGYLQMFIVTVGEFLQFFMGTTICESVNSASNIILGQTESPLLLKHYLHQLTDSEIHSIMTSGFATVSGSVFAGYISFGARATDLITASVMSAPAALCFSKLVYPETEKTSATKEAVSLSKSGYTSVLDAACKGASQGMELILGIISNVIALIAFVSFASAVLEWCGTLVGFTEEGETWTIYRITGYIFTPLSYIMGVPWDECYSVGRLIGLKTILNEFVAFQNMQSMVLTERTKVIATYAICGFSNPGSIGITVSGLSTLVPTKREVITRLVFRAFVGGAIVCLMTACIAAMVLPYDVII